MTSEEKLDLILNFIDKFDGQIYRVKQKSNQHEIIKWLEQQ